MLKHLRKIDTFGKNIILVFFGSSLANVFNLLYQLFVAHRLSPADFAAFNSLLSIFVLISSPLLTVQTGVAKYVSEYNACHEAIKIKVLLSGLFKNALSASLLVFFLFFFISPFIVEKLKIDSFVCGYILTILLALSWLAPVLNGGVQGLELFGWLSSISIVNGVLKLLLTVAFISLGFSIAGALGALLVSHLIMTTLIFVPLKKMITFSRLDVKINFREIFIYLFPVAISTFCFAYLVNMDMIMVKYFFSQETSGIYSLSQMLGKIFLFLPGAISMVMFPRASGLSFTNSETLSVLKKSLFYALCLCVTAILVYNFFPSFILKILTGKALPESIALGRMFSLSMTFFALLFILINYLLAIKDFRFIKFLVLLTCFQTLGIILFHGNLYQVQIVLCVISILLFSILMFFAYKKKYEKS